MLIGGVNFHHCLGATLEDAADFVRD